MGRAFVARAALVALALAAVGASAANAGPANLAVSGAPSEIKLDPGGTSRSTFTVRNPAGYDQSVQVVVTGVDVSSGSYDFTGPTPDGFRAEVDPRSFTLAAGASRNVSFTLTAGAGAPAGSSSFALVVRAVPPTAPGQSPVVGEIGIPVFATVAGKVDSSGRIDSFGPAHPGGKPGPVEWVTTFANTGTIHEQVTGRVDLFRGQTQVGTVSIPSALVLRATSRQLKATWAGDGQGESVRARVHLDWADGRTAEAESSVSFVAAVDGIAGRPRHQSPHMSASAVPVDGRLLSLAALLLLAVLIGLLLLFLRREMEADRPAVT